MARRKSYRYEGDDGDFYWIRMSVDRFEGLAENTEPVGTAEPKFHIDGLTGKNKNGIIPRHIVGSRTVGTGDDIALKYSKLPILDPVKIEAQGETPPEITVGTVFTSGSFTYSVVSVEPETSN